MSSRLLSQLPFSKFSRRLLPPWKLIGKKQTPLQSKSLRKMEFTKGNRATSLGRTYFCWFEPFGAVAWTVFTKNSNLAGYCISDRITDRNSCDFHHVKSYNSGQRISMGHICRSTVHNICAGFFVLPDFAQVTNFNCWIIPQNNCQIPQGKPPTVSLYSSVHWPDILIWTFDCVWVFGLFMFRKSRVLSKLSLLLFANAMVLDVPFGCANNLGIVIFQRFM